MSHSLKKNLTLLLASTGLGLTLAIPLGVLAHDEHATGIYKERHDTYEKLGDAFKTLRDQIRAGEPDVPAIQGAAEVVMQTSIKQYDLFPAGSGPQADAKTRAKPEIWSKPQDFAAAQKMFADAAKNLHAAAGTGNLAGVRAQFGEVGKSCKNCHDNFRTPED